MIIHGHAMLHSLHALPIYSRSPKRNSRTQPPPPWRNAPKKKHSKVQAVWQSGATRFFISSLPKFSTGGNPICKPSMRPHNTPPLPHLQAASHGVPQAIGIVSFFNLCQTLQYVLVRQCFPGAREGATLAPVAKGSSFCVMLRTMFSSAQAAPEQSTSGLDLSNNVRSHSTAPPGKLVYEDQLMEIVQASDPIRSKANTEDPTLCQERSKKAPNIIPSQ